MSFISIKKIPFILLLLISLSLYSQSEEEKEPIVSLLHIGFGSIRPTGGFAKKLNKHFAGGQVSYMLQAKSGSPVFVGFALEYYPLEDYETNLNEELSEKISTGFTGYNGYLRYYTPFSFKSLSFFSEMGFGVTHMYSTLTYPIENGEFDSENIKRDFGLQYGLSAGIHIKAGNGYVTTKIGHYQGTSVKYLIKKKDIPFDPPSAVDAFQITNSAINAVKWDIGYTFVF